MFADDLHIGFTENEKIFSVYPEPVRSELDLMRRLLARNIEYLQGLTEVLADLQKQSGFTYSGITAEKDKRTLDNTAAEHSVQFLKTGFMSDLTVTGNIVYHLNICRKAAR